MNDKGFDRLTPRELETLRLAARGLKPKWIARELSLSERTIYAHLGNAARKMDASSPGEAAMELARAEALGPYAKSTKQSLQVAGDPANLIDLLLPEIRGRRFNDLGVAHRVAVIVV